VITVVYDGQCQLCQNSINWLSKKLTFDALTYQQAPLEKYGLTLSECEKQVYAIYAGKTYGGVAAVIFLLKARGNRIASLLLKISGPLGSFTYKMIAANRRSVFVRALSRLIKKLS
jgi:predicted DCC family thiol-disulfide oxidoreductase YuxK